MNWFQSFLVSSIGQKIIMSLTGIFLMLFLVVHLVGNLQLLHDDGGQAFNLYTYFMTHNPLIKTISYLLYITVLIHAIQGILITRKNQASAGGMNRYVKKSTFTTTLANRYMAFWGILIFIFLVIHLKDFWYVMKFTSDLEMVTYPGETHEVKNLYQRVAVEFKALWVVILYVACMVALAFHLAHGFWSAFQTVGASHPKYLRLLKTTGKIFAFLIPLGFALIPVLFYLFK